MWYFLELFWISDGSIFLNCKYSYCFIFVNFFPFVDVYLFSWFTYLFCTLTIHYIRDAIQKFRKLRKRMDSRKFKRKKKHYRKRASLFRVEVILRYMNDLMRYVKYIYTHVRTHTHTHTHTHNHTYTHTYVYKKSPQNKYTPNNILQTGNFLQIQKYMAFICSRTFNNPNGYY